MKYCINCGKKLPDNVQFCPYCGTKQLDLDRINEPASLKTIVFTPQTSNSDPHAFKLSSGLINSTKLYFLDFGFIDKRVSLADFWWSQLGIALINLFVWLLSLLLFILPHVVMAPLTGFYIGMLAVGQTSAIIRRLHDSEKSGWLVLLGLIPFAGLIILIVFCCDNSKHLTENFFENDHKKWYQRWWIWVVAAVFSIFSLSNALLIQSYFHFYNVTPRISMHHPGASTPHSETKKANQEYYTVKLHVLKTEDDAWNITGTTDAPDDTKVYAVTADADYQLLLDSHVNVPTVHNGKFAGSISAITFEDRDDKAGDTVEIYALATNKNLLDSNDISISDKYLPLMLDNKFKQILTYTDKQVDYYNSLDDDDSTSSSSHSEDDEIASGSSLNYHPNGIILK